MIIIDMSPVLYGERLAEYRRMLNEKREAGNALTPALFHEFLLYNRKEKAMEQTDKPVKTVTLKELREMVENLPEGTILRVEFANEEGDDDGE